MNCGAIQFMLVQTFLLSSFNCAIFLFPVEMSSIANISDGGTRRRGRPPKDGSLEGQRISSIEKRKRGRPAKEEKNMLLHDESEKLRTEMRALQIENSQLRNKVGYKKSHTSQQCLDFLIAFLLRFLNCFLC